LVLHDPEGLDDVQAGVHELGELVGDVVVVLLVGEAVVVVGEAVVVVDEVVLVVVTGTVLELVGDVVVELVGDVVVELVGDVVEVVGCAVVVLELGLGCPWCLG
jgi:hypothetical protein